MEIASRILDDFLKIEKQVVCGIRPFALVGPVFKGRQEDIDIQFGRFQPLGVGFEKMEIIQPETACLFQDKGPVFQGMAQFLQEDFQCLRDTGVSGRNLLENLVLFIDGHIDVAARQIDLKGLGRHILFLRNLR